MTRRWPSTLALTAALLTALAAGACGGDEPDPSADASAGESPSDAPSTPSGEGPAEVCTPDLSSKMPAGLDPETCWSLYDGEQPVFTDGKLFALADNPDVADNPTIVAFDPANGELLWTSEPVESEDATLRAVEVDGEPGVAVLAVQRNEGDALNEDSRQWAYLTWPADSDSDEPVAPSAEVTAPMTEGARDDIVWSEQGVLAGDKFLAADAAEFKPVKLENEPVYVGDYDLGESVVGFSGELMISYVRGVAWTDGGGENGDTHSGWLARSLDGKQQWNTITSKPNKEDSLFGEGPSPLAVVVGDYLLAITPTDEEGTDFTVAWANASDGKAATPSPDDLAGTQPAAYETGTYGVPLLTPDGRYLFASVNEQALIIEVESGTVTQIESDYPITGRAIDNEAVHGTTPNGTVVIDLETGEAAPFELSHQSVDVSDGEYGAAVMKGSGPEDFVVVGRRTE